MYSQPGTGLSSAWSKIYHQDTADVANGAEPFDLFGSVLAAGKLDSDAYVDLVVGVPDEDVGALANAGMVHVFYGQLTDSSGVPGLNLTRDAVWSKDSSGIAGTATAHDRFGEALAIGDFRGDGIGDLAVGVTGEDVRLPGNNNGAVHVLHGYVTGLRAPAARS